MRSYPFFNFKEIKSKRLSLRSQVTHSSSLDTERLVKIDNLEKNRLIRQGRKEAIKELTKNGHQNTSQPKELSSMKDRELMRVKTVFPFVVFSDYLVVEENKITFIWGLFFWSKDIRSVLIKDIANVTVETGLLFAKIEVIDQFFAKAPLSISYLPKDQALEVRRLIQGLVVSVRERIDFQNLPKEEVIKYAMRLGEADANF